MAAVQKVWLLRLRMYEALHNGFVQTQSTVLLQPGHIQGDNTVESHTNSKSDCFQRPTAIVNAPFHGGKVAG